MRKARLPRRNLDPIVKALEESDVALSEILRSAPEPRSREIEVMLRLCDFLVGRTSWEAALQAAQSVELKAITDANLAILFLWLWARALDSAGREAEAIILVGRAQEMISEDTPLSVRVCVALWRGVTQNWAQREENRRKLLHAMPPDHPRYCRLLIEWVLFHAFAARGVAVEGDIEKLATHTQDYAIEATIVARLIHYVETGRSSEIAAQLAQLARHSDSTPTKNPAMAHTLAEYKLLAACLLGAPPAPEIEVPVSCQVVLRLLGRQPQEALRWARLQARDNPLLLFREERLTAFNLVRAELACGHWQFARRLIETRRGNGATHYLDDFFLARAELLAGNRESAARHFAAAIQACERFRAEGRLGFELQLACELPACEVVSLTRAAERLTMTGPVTSDCRGPSPPPEPKGSARLVGPSAAMVSVRTAVHRFAPMETPVLITGETGTGKELVARALHEESPRAAEPFVAINCGAIAETLLESELFGHERGSFTGANRARKGLFEEAGRGTILLDEIGDISPRLQVVLLRVLESGEIRPVGSNRTRKTACRILAATNADLARLVAEDRFRKDLYFRLRRMTVQLLPLRERREDILPLVEHFLAENRLDGKQPQMSSPLREELTRRDWPGNVRDLRNAIERMRLLNSDKLAYEVADLEVSSSEGEGHRPAAPKAKPGQQAAPPASLAASETREDYIRENTPLRRLDRLRALFARHGKLTRSEVALALAVRPPSATRDLKALLAEGLIVKVEPTRSPRTHYFRLHS